MMDGPGQRHQAFQNRTNRPLDAKARRLLAVGLNPIALALLPRHVVAPGSEVRSCAFDDLETTVLIGEEAPELIISPLLSPHFDALDLARHLSDAAFKGRYLALVEHLPSSLLIRREVKSQSPDINFDVIVLQGAPRLHSL